MKQTNCRNQGWLVGEGDPIQPTFIQNGAWVENHHNYHRLHSE